MSAPWVTGGRVSPRVVERRLAALLLGGRHDEEVTRVVARCGRAWRQAHETLGPASGATAVWRLVLHPVADALGWSTADDEADRWSAVPVRVGHGRPGGVPTTFAALPWGASQEGLQRYATRRGALDQSRWVSVTNGVTWRWYDAARPYARDHLGFDLTRATTDARVWQALWLLGQRAPGPAGERVAWLERLVADGVRESATEAGALRDGVVHALRGVSTLVAGSHDAHVLQVFQWLFLLFADARGLRPRWHAGYRRSYSVARLARDSRAARAPVGVRESLVAIARLNREGGRVGALDVSALDGPLFAEVPIARASAAATDAMLGEVLTALAYGAPARAQPLDVAALDVEHLGSIYEHLIAPPTEVDAPPLLRKRTGAFYTPRVLADDLVHRTLAPLVHDASSEQILALRILDPAMGSGALLASAHRFLMNAVESAWVREGRSGPLDVTRDERDALPRRIAEQCLFGIDVNARAVQVARLSLWLLSMAPDRPLTWLDAHLRVGNSLVGASPALIASRPPVGGPARRRRADAQPTLFDLSRWYHEATESGRLFSALHARPTRTAEDVRVKVRTHESLRARPDLAAWRARADAWCGAAMDPDATPAAWRAVDDLLRGESSHGSKAVASCRTRWLALAHSQGALHWSLEFPDVFDGGRGGFDAVIANPPWEMLRGDLGSDRDRAVQRDDLGPLRRFVQRSGLYPEARGHLNSYQLFVERMRHLVRPGGRLGCLLPGSLLTDQGAATLRARLLDATTVDRVSVISNREGLFPIHRSMRVVTLTATAEGRTEALVVDDGPVASSATGDTPAARQLTRALLRRGSADEAIPTLRDAEELALFEQLLHAPRLGGDGWQLRFGRELNATEDRDCLRVATPGDLTIVDGKHLSAFLVCPPAAGLGIGEQEARARLPTAPWCRWRLAYRDVSGPTNSRSLIAALLPPGCVSTHTLFCLRSLIPVARQVYLCGMLNSLPADWFVRRYLGAHVTTRLIATLPVPAVPRAGSTRRHVARLVLRLMRQPDDRDAFIALQAIAASLYGLDRTRMATVLRDFPRLADDVGDAILARL